MKELDLLKKDWHKNTNSFIPVQDTELYGMLHKKSSSVVKILFIISVFEILLWIGISLFFNTDQYFKNIEFELFIEIFNYSNYLITLIFICFFYRNYIAISTIVSTKRLMIAILKTRKTVQFYVWYNLSIILISVIIGFYVGIVDNNKSLTLKDDFTINDTNIFVLTLILVVVIGVILGAFWLFYRLLYGILLQKLQSNYKELQKIVD